LVVDFVPSRLRGKRERWSCLSEIAYVMAQDPNSLPLRGLASKSVRFLLPLRVKYEV
jgi:hypothetical protein